MKKMFKFLMLLCLVCCINYVYCLITNNDINLDNEVLVNYDGNNLMINIDGYSSRTLPTTGNYYLTEYACDNSNTVVTWNSGTFQLGISNGTNGGGVSCELTFESNPPLNKMPAGGYVSYVGKGGYVGGTYVSCQNDSSLSSDGTAADVEAPLSCIGQNAREDLNADVADSLLTYGYCYTQYWKFQGTGWRIAYIDDNGDSDVSNNKAVIISAGVPECFSKKTDMTGESFIQTVNAMSLKYCNPDFVDSSCFCVGRDTDSDGVYDLCTNPSNDTWMLNDTDFYNIIKTINGAGKRLTDISSALGDSGGSLGTRLYCYAANDVKYGYKDCGYNSELLDIGGYYWFASIANSDGDELAVWWPDTRRIGSSSANGNGYGLRPVVSLSSSVYVIGGTGTMNDPYIIAN